jgi:uncharacterized protein (TIGR03435 family)
MVRHLWIGLAASMVLASSALIASGVRAQGQGQFAPLPQFDVASVIPNKMEGQPSNNWQLAPGRINYQRSQMLRLIRAAWGDNSLRVEGGPGWITTDRFDVVVQFPVDTPAPTRNLMLRELLIDRFKLAAHLEMREVPIYFLVVARPDRKLGSKLEPGMPECVPPWPGRTTPPPQCGAGVGRGRVQVGFLDMAGFARMLSEMQAAGRPVVDNTSLTGSYKIELKFAPDPAASAPPASDAPLPGIDPEAPSIFTALQEQLGLKLEGARGQVPVLVLDHIEHPTPD